MAAVRSEVDTFYVQVIVTRTARTVVAMAIATTTAIIPLTAIVTIPLHYYYYY